MKLRFDKSHSNLMAGEEFIGLDNAPDLSSRFENERHEQ